MTVHVQCCNTGSMKKKMNTTGSVEKILLCNSCVSYQHLKIKTSEKHNEKEKGEFNMKLRGQIDEDKIKGQQNKTREQLKTGEVWGLSVANKQLAGDEILKLKLRKQKGVKDIKN